jgi:hypothetical protein
MLYWFIGFLPFSWSVHWSTPYRFK